MVAGLSAVGTLVGLPVLLAGFAVVILIYSVIFIGLSVITTPSDSPPLHADTTPETSIYADTSSDAICSVEPAVRGSTTTILLPLVKSDYGSAAPDDWYVKDVLPVDSTNALISTTSYIGIPPGGNMPIEVRPLIPGQPYGIDGVLVRLVSGDDERVQTMRLAMSSDDTHCTVGAGHELDDMYYPYQLGT